MNNISHELLTELSGLAKRWRFGELDSAVFAALYFLHWQISKHGRQFASRKNKSDPRPDAKEWLTVMEAAKGEDLRRHSLDWLERYQFRNVTGNVTVALVQWLRGAWPLILRENVPSPRDILHWQAQGTRAVTVLTEYPRLHKAVLSKPDALAFFLHDLEHAYKFFHLPALHTGQCALFVLLEDAFDRGVFVPYFNDAEFAARFYYLMSDMNTHPEHGRQYLRAILVECYLRREHKAPSDPLSSAAELAIEEVLRSVGIPMPVIACA